MDAAPGSKLNQQPPFSYRSLAGSSQGADLSRLPKGVPLKPLVSGGPGVSEVRRTDGDSLVPAAVLSITFVAVVTFALILHIHLGESWASHLSGVLVSDNERCTALGLRVLQDGGSSVDAAVGAALCLTVVHPHLSGVGGGGVMLVHDIRKNQTRVIDYQGAAPKSLHEELLGNVSALKAGLHVGVPGMLRGFHHAHSLYGSLSWTDLISRVAAVARDGFTVSSSLAEAVSQVRGEQLSQRFRDTFFPGGRALRPGSRLRLRSLAGVLEAGVSNFYDGSVSQEMVDEVRANGGVLSRDDISSYRVAEERPVERCYGELIVQVPPPPSAGAALISALRLLESSGNRTRVWIGEALRAALRTTGGLVSDPLRTSGAEVLHRRTGSSPVHRRLMQPPAGQVVAVGADDLMVSVASSLSKPFGSAIMTRSGIVLNGLLLGFSWPGKKTGAEQPGRRPASLLMPTLVVPAGRRCGVRAALSSAGGLWSLSGIAQVLVRNTSSPSLRRLRHKLDPGLPEELLRMRPAVRGILRTDGNAVSVIR